MNQIFIAHRVEVPADVGRRVFVKQTGTEIVLMVTQVVRGRCNRVIYRVKLVFIFSSQNLSMAAQLMTFNVVFWQTFWFFELMRLSIMNDSNDHCIVT